MYASWSATITVPLTPTQLTARAMNPAVPVTTARTSRRCCTIHRYRAGTSLLASMFPLLWAAVLRLTGRRDRCRFEVEHALGVALENLVDVLVAATGETLVGRGDGVRPARIGVRV